MSRVSGKPYFLYILWSQLVSCLRISLNNSEALNWSSWSAGACSRCLAWRVASTPSRTLSKSSLLLQESGGKPPHSITVRFVQRTCETRHQDAASTSESAMIPSAGATSTTRAMPPPAEKQCRIFSRPFDSAPFGCAPFVFAQGKQGRQGKLGGIRITPRKSPQAGLPQPPTGRDGGTFVPWPNSQDDGAFQVSRGT